MSPEQVKELEQALIAAALEANEQAEAEYNQGDNYMYEFQNGAAEAFMRAVSILRGISDDT